MAFKISGADFKWSGSGSFSRLRIIEPKILRAISAVSLMNLVSSSLELLYSESFTILIFGIAFLRRVWSAYKWEIGMKSYSAGTFWLSLIRLDTFS